MLLCMSSGILSLYSGQHYWECVFQAGHEYFYQITIWSTLSNDYGVVVNYLSKLTNKGIVATINTIVGICLLGELAPST